MAPGMNLRLPDSAGPERLAVQNYLTPADTPGVLETLRVSLNSSL